MERMRYVRASVSGMDEAENLEETRQIRLVYSQINIQFINNIKRVSSIWSLKLLAWKIYQQIP